MNRIIRGLMDGIGSITSLVAIVYSVASIIGDFTGQSIPTIFGGPSLLAVVYLISIVYLFTKYQNTTRILKNYQKTKPNIVVESVFLEKPFPLLVGNVATQIIIERYYLQFRNKRTRGVDIIDTGPVHAKVFFYDESFKELPLFNHEEPRWLDFKKPSEMPMDHQVIIRSSGKPEGLHLVVREQGKKELYVFSRKSYNLSRNSSLEPFEDRFKLTADKYYIEVHLTTGNADIEPIWIKLTNLGADQPPSFMILDKSPIENHRQ